MTKPTKQVELPEELKKRLWETEHHFNPGVNERMYRHSDVEKLLAQAQQEAAEREREFCKKLYIDGCEWSEWGISDEEAGQNFDEDYKEALIKTSR